MTANFNEKTGFLFILSAADDEDEQIKMVYEGAFHLTSYNEPDLDGSWLNNVQRISEQSKKNISI